MSASLTQPRELKSLTGIRGVAACYVMLYHFSLDGVSGFALRVMRHGYMSVDLFFILSGFVMALTYAPGFRRSPGPHAYFDFLLKRFARIYPLYLCITLLAALMIGLHRVGGPPMSASTLAANLLLVQGWGIASSISSPAWSISTEFAAYFAFPFLAARVSFGSRRWPWAVMLAGAALLIIVVTRSDGNVNETLSAGIVRHGPLDVYAPGTVYPLLRCLSGFIMGVAAFALFRARALQIKALGTLTDLVTVLLIVLLLFPGTDLAVALLFVPLVGLLSYEQGFTARLVNHPICHWLGLVSYSIYMDHFLVREILDPPLRKWFAELNVPAPQVTRHAVLIVCSIAAAALTYYGIEKPARQRIRLNMAGASTSLADAPMASDPPAP